MGVQELIQNRGRIVRVAAVALDQGRKGEPGSLTFQALGSPAPVLELRIVPPTVENPLCPYPPAMLTGRRATFLGEEGGDFHAGKSGQCGNGRDIDAIPSAGRRTVHSSLDISQARQRIELADPDTGFE